MMSKAAEMTVLQAQRLLQERRDELRKQSRAANWARRAANMVDRANRSADCKELFGLRDRLPGHVASCRVSSELLEALREFQAAGKKMKVRVIGVQREILEMVWLATRSGYAGTNLANDEWSQLLGHGVSSIQYAMRQLELRRLIVRGRNYQEGIFRAGGRTYRRRRLANVVWLTDDARDSLRAPRSAQDKARTVWRFRNARAQELGRLGARLSGPAGNAFRIVAAAVAGGVGTAPADLGTQNLGPNGSRSVFKTEPALTPTPQVPVPWSKETGAGPPLRGSGPANADPQGCGAPSQGDNDSRSGPSGPPDHPRPVGPLTPEAPSGPRTEAVPRKSAAACDDSELEEIFGRMERKIRAREDARRPRARGGPGESGTLSGAWGGAPAPAIASSPQTTSTAAAALDKPDVGPASPEGGAPLPRPASAKPAGAS